MEEHIEKEGTFTDTISAPDWSNKVAEIFLLSLGWCEIHYIALAHRGKRVATLKHGNRFTDFVKFDPAAAFDDIQRHLNPRIERQFIRATSELGSRAYPKTWHELWRVIKELKPQNVSDLDQLEQLKQPHEFASRRGIDIVKQERDATNLALRLAGFDPLGHI